MHLGERVGYLLMDVPRPYGNRQRQYSEARSVLAWLAVEEVGHPAAEVARFLGISRVGVLLSLEKAKNICQKYEFQLTPPNPTDSIC